MGCCAGGAMTLFFRACRRMNGVLEEGTSCCVMKSHAVEGKSGNWHDCCAGKGHAVEGKSGNRHDSRRIAHVKKKKARNDVFGAALAAPKQPYRTRQKGKNKKWRVRSRPRRPQTAVSHTSKRKKQEMACAERPPPAPNRRTAHAKKKKARNGVCGAALSPL